MKFSIVLYGFHLLLRYTAWRYESFKTVLGTQDFSMTIATADGKKSRRYSFSGGTISTSRSIKTESDFSLIWKDAAAGYRYMIQMKQKALMLAISDGSLKLRGEAQKVSAFLEVYRKMLDCYRKPASGREEIPG
jgi:hypothetical protein